MSKLDAGLETFLQLIGADLGMPKIEVDLDSISIRLQRYETRAVLIRISNTSRGYLFGTIELSEAIDGLFLSEASFGLDAKKDSKTDIELRIDGSLLVPGKRLYNAIIINSNADNGQVIIPTEIEIYRTAIASAPALWLITMPLAILISVFQYNYMRYEIAGDYLASGIAPIVAVLAGLVGIVVYNVFWSNSAKKRDNYIVDYLLSLLSYGGFSIAGFIAIYVVIVVAIIALIVIALFALLSGGKK